LALNDSTIIRDSPRFQYRGLMLDTARHYIPIPILKKQIDSMAYNKLNVFHWHIVDDQSFPFEMKKYPNITKNGQYTPAHVYTQQQVLDIIQHARLRGIRVIPEFDTPGHVAALGRSFPGILYSIKSIILNISYFYLKFKFRYNYCLLGTCIFS
jgi:hexosaminidase